MNKLQHNHPYHLVTYSPWPLIISLSICNNLIFFTSWFHKFYTLTMILSLPCTFICSYLWWQNIIRETTYQGCHTSYVYTSMKMGMILFIISEVSFFFSFFWAYFHSSLAPSIEIGQLWPPKGVTPFNPFDIPLLNTIILISSGLTITWSHHSMIMMNLSESKKSLSLTIFLGIYFTILQIIEYLNSPFTIADSIYGSTFFVTTGFHGIHVIIGSTFLLFCLYRLTKLHFSSYHHFGFEAAAWYWHFVDVIWLLLFISMYWWSFPL